MIKAILYKTLLLIVFTQSAYSAPEKTKEKNGYIVKLKDKRNYFTLFTNQIKVKEEIELQTGTFLHITFKNNKSQKSLNDLKKHPAVDYIEPNSIQRGFDHEIPVNPPSYIRDKFFKSQWGLRNSGHNNWFNSPAGVDINMLKGWKNYRKEENIIIAVVDSGVNYNHPDLKNNIWKNDQELNGTPGVDDDGNGYIDDVYGYDFINDDSNPIDDHKVSHGTHIIGIIAAEHNNIGIRGILPNAKVMGLKFLNSKNKGTTLAAIKAISYAIDKGAKIINLSWGSHEKSKALTDILKYGNKKKVLFVTAAGNSNQNNELKPIYPASYNLENIISVGALDPRNKKAAYSNYSEKLVDIFAPGFNIISCDKNGKYNYNSGTSQAAPFVTGALGLLLSARPELNYLEAKTKLIRSSKKVKKLKGLSVGGRLDIEALLR